MLWLPDLRLERVFYDGLGDVAGIVGHHRDREPCNDLERLIRAKPGFGEGPQIPLVDVPAFLDEGAREQGGELDVFGGPLVADRADVVGVDPVDLSRLTPTAPRANQGKLLVAVKIAT
jgi:hypothetical protein